LTCNGRYVNNAAYWQLGGVTLASEAGVVLLSRRQEVSESLKSDA
jgi:hypothetical protein